MTSTYQPRTRLFRPGPEDIGKRLDVAVAGWLGESRTRAAERIDQGRVLVGGHAVKRSHRLGGDERVVVLPPPPEPTGAAGIPPPPVRYEDEHVLVVAKPAGMVVHPGVGHTAGTMIQTLAEAGYPLASAGGRKRPGVVHRLDKDTSGLLAVAKSDVAHAELVRQLKARTVTRGYLALVEGRLPAAHGRVEAPIGRDPRDRKRLAAVADGKPAVTHWEVGAEGVADRHGTVTLVRCRLETGRTHQVRIHLAYSGHPVVGDRTYGARCEIADALGVVRPFLHAWRLAFTHPVTGERIALTEPPPADLTAACHRAGIADPAGLSRDGGAR